MTQTELINLLLGPAGLTVALLFALIGVVRGWWVPGGWYRKLETDRDEWKMIAMRSIDTADKAVTMVEPP